MSKFDCVSIVQTPYVTLVHVCNVTLFVNADFVTAFTSQNIEKIVKDNPARFGDDAVFFTDANDVYSDAKVDYAMITDLRRVRKVLGTTLLVLCVVDPKRTDFEPLFMEGENYYDILNGCLNCLRETMPDYAYIAERCQRGLLKIKKYLGNCEGPEYYQKIETFAPLDIVRAAVLVGIITRITR